MILRMAQVRLLGPTPLLPECLAALQDLGCVQLEANPPDVGQPPRTHVSDRRVHQLSKLLTDTEKLIARLEHARIQLPADTPRSCNIVDWTRRCSRLSRRLDVLQEERARLAEERQLIIKYIPFLKTFAAALHARSRMPHAAIYHLLLRSSESQVVARLRSALATLLPDDFELISRTLSDGTVGVLLIVSEKRAADVERLLADAHVQQLLLPEPFVGQADPLQAMRDRLHEIRTRARAIHSELTAIAQQHGAELRGACADLHDWTALQRAASLSRDTGYAFVLQGWTPAEHVGVLREALHASFGDAVVVDEIAVADWPVGDAPVVLHNPPLFRPFEILVKALPLPRYGSIDPTPFVAVFFPVFVGMMIGDVGYGIALALFGLFLIRGSASASVRRAAGKIAGACALFAVVFGIAFGELFVDFGRTQFGLQPLLLEREEALVPFLLIALGLGLVHILLGLVIGVINAARAEPRLAIGRGLTAAMLLLIVVALLTLVNVLPRTLLTPATVALLICFPLLIVIEGFIGAVEFFSTLANVLSYARVMALGTASVMMAIAANRMSGAVGSLAVGIIFALLFHVVNFALALFSPTIHGLRLHYVEFFRQFYSPGGTSFEPFAHWRAETTSQAGNGQWKSSGSHSAQQSPSDSPPSARRGRSRKLDRPVPQA
ncbi:MAG TPA: V-type ATPase 116kDa subunit family protein [Longimicrobiales bacterium]